MQFHWQRQAAPSKCEEGGRKWKIGTAAKAVVLGTGISALALAGSVAFATNASASAYGCTFYGHHVTYKGVTVYNGTWCGTVTGNGTYVNYVGGNFYTHLVPLDSVCNFSEVSDFYNSNGDYYGYVQTPTYHRCSNASDLPNIYLNRNMRSGYVLMKLIANGATVAAVKESIL
jgi:hypothetical protein